MKRPAGITVTTRIMCLLNAAGLFYWIHSGHAVLIFVLDLITVLLGYVFLYYYWLGREWARWLVMLTCLLCFWNLQDLGHKSLSPVVKPTVILEALLAVYLLYFLNTRPVVAWFNPPKATETYDKLTAL